MAKLATDDLPIHGGITYDLFHRVNMNHRSIVRVEVKGIPNNVRVHQIQVLGVPLKALDSTLPAVLAQQKVEGLRGRSSSGVQAAHLIGTL